MGTTVVEGAEQVIGPWAPVPHRGTPVIPAVADDLAGTACG
ncbi:hypothetical protein [Streptomyces griseorubiginosus]